MRRAIAGIITLFVLLAISIFVPMVPSSATASRSGSSSGGNGCAMGIPRCILAGESVHGYGSLSYYLMGKGAFYCQGNYQVMSNTNLSLSFSA